MRPYLLFIICGILFLNSTAFAQLVSSNAFLQGQWLEAAIAPNGSWGNTVNAPAGYHIHTGGDIDYYGTADPTMDFNYTASHGNWLTGSPVGPPCCWYGPYYMPGTPFDGWSMQVNGARSDAWFTNAGFWNAIPATSTLTGTITGYQHTNPTAGCTGATQGQMLGVWTGTAGAGGALKITQTNRLDTFASWVVVTTVFVNTSATTMDSLFYWVSADPDNDEVIEGGSFPTDNRITYQDDVDNRSLVWARPPTITADGLLHQDAFSSLSTKDCRGKVLIYDDWADYPEESTTNTLSEVYYETAGGWLGTTYYAVGQMTLDQDIAYGLIYSLGNLAPGDSTFISYTWGFTDSTVVDSAFPEPLLYVNCSSIAPSGPAPAPTYDTINPCLYPPGTVISVNIANATDKCWSWSSWSWAPATGLASTTGVNNTITFAALTAETTYTITGTYAPDAQTCNQRTMYITILPPCFNATNNGPICFGDTLKLSAHGDSTGATYTWIGPGLGGPTLGTGQFLNIYPATFADSGDIYVIKNEGGGVFDTVFTHVIIKQLPYVTPTSNAPICSGNTLDLFANLDSTGETYSWIGPNGFTSILQNPTITTIPVSGSGTYKVYTELDGCIDSASETVVIDSTPAVPKVGSNSPVCSGDTLLLTSSDTTSGVSYSWTGPSGFSSSLQNPDITGVAVTASGTYTVTVTLGMCTDSAATVVVINQTPVAPALSSNSPVCSGTSLDFTATSTAGSTYSWTGVNGFSSSLQNPTIDPATTLATGTYSVIATLDNCPSKMSTIDAVVDSTPAAPVASSNSPGPPSICEGDTLELFSSDATSGVGYSWVGPNSFASTLQNPQITNVTMAANGQYTVTVSNGTICTNQAIITVSITAIPALTATSNSPVCTGDTLLLQAIAPAGSTYNWTGPFYFSSGAPNPQRDSVVLEYGGVYQVTILLNGCSNMANDTVVVNQTPPPPWIVPLQNVCRYYPPTALMADGSNILWYPTDTTNGIGSAIPPVPPTGSDTTMWFYLTQTVNGCISSLDSMEVIVLPKPVVTLGNDTAICPLASVTLTAIDTVDANATYSWSPSMYLNNVTGSVVVAKPETNMTYVVIASNQYGCTDTASVSISVYPGAVITLPDSSVTLYPGQNYQISPVTNCTAFLWFPPGGLSDAYISDPLATPAISTQYVVYGTTEQGCTAKDSINIFVDPNSLLAVPNAFTPGNGPNNLFKIIVNGEATLNYFHIYNRWGNLVYSSADINVGWDGTFNGQPQPFDVYVYEIEAVTSTGTVFHKTGNVTLLR